MSCNTIVNNLYEPKMDVIYFDPQLQHDSGDRDNKTYRFASYFPDEDLYRRFTEGKWKIMFFSFDYVIKEVVNVQRATMELWMHAGRC